MIRLFHVVYGGFFSPLLHFFSGPGSGCRFYPSCSHYFSEAVERHGIIRGSGKGLRRISKCHPWGTSGFDPVL